MIKYTDIQFKVVYILLRLLQKEATRVKLSNQWSEITSTIGLLKRTIAQEGYSISHRDRLNELRDKYYPYIKAELTKN